MDNEKELLGTADENTAAESVTETAEEPVATEEAVAENAEEKVAEDSTAPESDSSSAAAFCRNCGAPVKADDVFCKQCGTATGNVNVAAQDSSQNGISPFVPVVNSKPKMKIFKKWWFWLIVVVLAGGIVFGAIAIADSASSSSSSSSSSSASTYVNPYVSMVKNATNSTYGITYGRAFNQFFSDPEWSYFTATTGEHVIEFEGEFSYDGLPATAKIQFVVDVYEGSFTIYHLSINDVDQSKLMLSALITKVFESAVSYY